MNVDLPNSTTRVPHVSRLRHGIWRPLPQREFVPPNKTSVIQSESKDLLFRIFSILALLLPAAIRAQTPPSPQAFAATIDHHYNALHSLSVHFTQQYDGMGIHRTESGALLLKKPGRMRWTYSSPSGKLFILDGHDAWFYTPGQNEIPKVPAKKLDDLRSPLAFLLGHAALAKQLQDLSLSSTAGGEWTLSGVPQGMEKRVASLAITATPSGVISAMRVEETDGAVNVFRLADEEANVPAPAAEFTFSPPPGTHVVEGMPPI